MVFISTKTIQQKKRVGLKENVFIIKPHHPKLPIDLLKSPSIREALHLTLYNFSIDEQMIIRMYYHIEMTIGEIARVSGITHDYIVGTLIVYSERLKHNINASCKNTSHSTSDMVDVKELFESEYENC